LPTPTDEVAMTPLGEAALRGIPEQPPRRTELLEGLRLTRALRGPAIGIPIAIVVLVAVLPLLVLIAHPELPYWLRSSRVVEARVERVDEALVCGQKGVEILYAFTAPDGVGYRGRKSLCAGSPYAKLREGDSLPARFVVADPTINSVAGTEPRLPLELFLLVPLLGLFVTAPMLWPQLKPVLHDRKLFRTGALARGRVTFARKQSESWSSSPLLARAEVFVAIRLPGGEESEVRATCTNDWLLSHLAPGTEVAVCHAGGRAMLVENYLR
jgi:hypothetical protein